MSKEWAKPFYNSKAWKKTRKAYIQNRIAKDGGMCEECGERPGEMVHHTCILTPENINDPEVTLSFSKLKYLCKDCHDRQEGHWIGSTGESEAPRCVFDAAGNPVEARPPCWNNNT